MTGKSGPIGLFMRWYDYGGPRMQPDQDSRGIPAQAFAGRLSGEGQAGEEYRA